MLLTAAAVQMLEQKSDSSTSVCHLLCIAPAEGPLKQTPCASNSIQTLTGIRLPEVYNSQNPKRHGAKIALLTVAPYMEQKAGTLLLHSRLSYPKIELIHKEGAQATLQTCTYGKQPGSALRSFHCCTAEHNIPVL